MLRQTLQSALGALDGRNSGRAGRRTASCPLQASAASLAPSLSPDLDIQEILLPQARLVVAENLARPARPPAIRSRQRSMPDLRPGRP